MMAVNKASGANTGATPKRKAGGKPFEKGDKRINRAGAPKRGESWGEIINRVFSMTGAEIADYTMPLAKQLRQIGDDVTLKEAVILRVGVALMNEPTPGLFNAVMDRAEGTPTQSVTVSGDDEKPLAFRVVETDSIRAAVGVAVIEGGPEGHLRASGEGESAGDGAALG